MKLYKTTIVVWTDYDPSHYLATDIIADGGGYVSYRNSRPVIDHENDPHWDGNNHFTLDATDKKE